MSGAGLVAAGSVGLAVLLCWPRSRLPRRAHGRARVRPWLVLGAAVLGGVLLAQLLHGTRLVVGLVGLATAVGIHRLVGLARGDAAAAVVTGQVLEACEQMAADLTAGQTPSAALARAAREWPPLAPAAAAAHMGGDVPAALHDLSTRPGAGDLRIVAAAWQVAHRAGSGLASALDTCVGTIRDRRRTTRLVATELASARATAHLMAVLPVGVLLLGSGTGGDPVGFLLGEPVGVGCLAAGAALSLSGLFWLQRISRQVLSDV